MKKGQIAHLDRKPSNNKLDNLCFLCLDHHNEYDSTPSQSRKFNIAEITEYRDNLYAFIQDQISNPKIAKGDSDQGDSQSCTFELYERRLKIYYGIKALLDKIIATDGVELADFRAFSTNTEEAYFLFDEAFNNFLSEIYRKAARLHTTGKKLKHLPAGAERSTVCEEEEKIINWISESYSELRKKMKKFTNVR